MPTKDETLRILRQNLPRLKAEYGVTRLAIFGSVARDTNNDDSDVDIIAEFGSPLGLRFVQFAEHLEQILGAKADVLTRAGLAGIRNPQVAENIRESVIDV